MEHQIKLHPVFQIRHLKRICEKYLIYSLIKSKILVVMNYYPVGMNRSLRDDLYMVIKSALALEIKGVNPDLLIKKLSIRC